jgi:hypothetical protein
LSYLFETYHQLIHANIPEDLDSHKLGEETRSIVKSVDQELFKTQTRTQAEFYIQKVELAIANHETEIQNLLHNNDSIVRASHLQSCLISLDTIKHHIETTYSVYRDATKSISRQTLSKLSKGLKLREGKLSALLKKNSISEKLTNVILYPIQNITSTEDTEVSQQKIEYITVFIDELIQFLESLVNVEEQQLLQYLYILNFNNIALLCYICEHYKSMKGEIEDDKSLLDHLYQCKNRLNSIPQSARKPYNVDLNDLKIQVQTWIQEEIVNVKKAIKQKSKEALDNNGTKLSFNHSVDLIASFFRLLHDTGVTDSGANQTVRWIAQNISSKNQPNISQQSIQRKFFEKHSNKEPLKGIVIHLLNHLNRK